MPEGLPRGFATGLVVIAVGAVALVSFVESNRPKTEPQAPDLTERMFSTYAADTNRGLNLVEFRKLVADYPILTNQPPNPRY